MRCNRGDRIPSAERVFNFDELCMARNNNSEFLLTSIITYKSHQRHKSINAKGWAEATWSTSQLSSHWCSHSELQTALVLPRMAPVFLLNAPLSACCSVPCAAVTGGQGELCPWHWRRLREPRANMLRGLCNIWRLQNSHQKSGFATKTEYVYNNEKTPVGN